MKCHSCRNEVGKLSRDGLCVTCEQIASAQLESAKREGAFNHVPATSQVIGRIADVEENMVGAEDRLATPEKKGRGRPRKIERELVPSTPQAPKPNGKATNEKDAITLGKLRSQYLDQIKHHQAKIDLLLAKIANLDLIAEDIGAML